ncbi:hypothetical protein DOTSEDRAFT_66760 [Dothistroma septosporum NZE10]|uniref:UDP-glucose 6-dehydrogenase n=1 Tax=Dothistroma septosporum (strain NZE10 / CBS 128990) TaxID=675120 RepID=M2YIK7_DOTSN|nr:hypothetical protein DOTSEDRAFT_66760 [Dothistroma septosporum NZE10]
MTRSCIERGLICCIGAGYVGGPTCAKVTVVVLNQDRIDAWCSNDLPVFEPGLHDIVTLAREGTGSRRPNLFFSTNDSQAIDEADLIFISVNTPTKTTGTGAGYAPDLAYNDKIIVEKSTVPCGAASSLRAIFDALAPSLRFDILSNPEFLAEGTVVKDLLDPDRVLIGSLPDERSIAAMAALADIYSTWVPRSRIITINLCSISSFSAICEATGANVGDLAHAVGMDSRIGSRMLKPSVGFGGSCFKKDVLSLVYIAECLHLPEVAQYWQSVVSINEYQKNRITKRIISRLNNTLWGKKNTRESAAISVIHQLLQEKAQITVYDPKVSSEAVFAALEHQPPSRDATPDMIRSSITVCSGATTACANASAVVILTEWDHFKTDKIPVCFEEESLWSAGSDGEAASTDTVSSISSKDSGIDVETPLIEQKSSQSLDKLAESERIDWVSIARVVRKPGLVFDGRDVVEPAKLAKLVFRVECIGKPTTMIHAW